SGARLRSRGGCVVARGVCAQTAGLSGRACGSYSRLSCNGAIALRQYRAAATDCPGAVRAGPEWIVFPRIRILPRAIGEVAHAAHTRTLCFEKSSRGNSGKPGQLLQFASWFARAGDNSVLGLDRKSVV